MCENSQPAPSWERNLVFLKQEKMEVLTSRAIKAAPESWLADFIEIRVDGNVRRITMGP